MSGRDMTSVGIDVGTTTTQVVLSELTVTNQARMHERNGHAPYRDLADALAHWPETATAIAARLGPGGVEILAPHGLADLLALIARPTPAYRAKPGPVLARIAAKGWAARR